MFELLTFESVQFERRATACATALACRQGRKALARGPWRSLAFLGFASFSGLHIVAKTRGKIKNKEKGEQRNKYPGRTCKTEFFDRVEPIFRPWPKPWSKIWSKTYPKPGPKPGRMPSCFGSQKAQVCETLIFLWCSWFLFCFPWFLSPWRPYGLTFRQDFYSIFSAVRWLENPNYPSKNNPNRGGGLEFKAANQSS